MNVVPYLIASVKYNIGGSNAVGKPHRNCNVVGSINIIMDLATMIADDPRYYMVEKYYHNEIKEAMKLLNGETSNILALRT